MGKPPSTSEEGRLTLVAVPAPAENIQHRKQAFGRSMWRGSHEHAANARGDGAKDFAKNLNRVLALPLGLVVRRARAIPQFRAGRIIQVHAAVGRGLRTLVRPIATAIAFLVVCSTAGILPGELPVWCLGLAAADGLINGYHFDQRISEIIETALHFPGRVTHPAGLPLHEAAVECLPLHLSVQHPACTACERVVQSRSRSKMGPVFARRRRQTII